MGGDVDLSGGRWRVAWRGWEGIKWPGWGTSGGGGVGHDRDSDIVLMRVGKEDQIQIWGFSEKGSVGIGPRGWGCLLETGDSRVDCFRGYL